MMDSLSSAVQGVVVQPVEGFDREGGVGFAKGVAKGVAGYESNSRLTMYLLTSDYHQPFCEARGRRDRPVLYHRYRGPEYCHHV